LRKLVKAYRIAVKLAYNIDMVILEKKIWVN